MMSIFWTLFLLRLIFNARAFEPPPEFCGSISGLCANHSFCMKTLALDDSSRNEFPRKFEYDSFMRKDFLQSMNVLRNDFACGNPPLENIMGEVFPKAAHMPEVTWDEELEWGADQYASQCTRKADSNCAVTPNFREVGIFFLDANLASYKSQKIALLTEFFSKLYDPHVLVSTESIKKYNDEFLHSRFSTEESMEDVKLKLQNIGGKVPSSRYVESFKTMIHDEVSKMGCATYDCGKNHGLLDFITVCLVDNRNLPNKPIYTGSNVAGSNCENLHTERKCLCAAHVAPPKTELIPKQTEPGIEKTTPLQCEKVVEMSTNPTHIGPLLPAQPIYPVQPVHPAHPMQPVRSMYPAAHPIHPTHPTHPTRYIKVPTTRPSITVITKYPRNHPPVICIKRPKKKSDASDLAPGFIIFIVFLNF